MARPAPELTGHTFGRLTVTGPGPPLPSGKKTWACRCDCGATPTVPAGRLLDAQRPTRSCGCLRAEEGRRKLSGQVGEGHHSARLSREQVMLARRLAAEGYTLGEIADHLRVGVDKSTLSLAVRGKTWRRTPPAG